MVEEDAFLTDLQGLFDVCARFCECCIMALQAEGLLRKIADKTSSPTICVSLYLNKVIED